MNIASSISSRLSIVTKRFHQNEDGGLPFISTILLLAILYLLIFAFNVINDVYEKEISQHAADSVAYSTALWKARGMNQIATINHLMGEVSAYNVLYKSTGAANANPTATGEERTVKQINDELVKAFSLNETGGLSILGKNFSGLLVDFNKIKDYTSSREMARTHSNQGACYDAEMVDRVFITRSLCDVAEGRCYFESGWIAYETMFFNINHGHYLYCINNPSAFFNSFNNAAKLFTNKENANVLDAFAQLAGNLNGDALGAIASAAANNVTNEKDIISETIKTFADELSNINQIFKTDFRTLLDDAKSDFNSFKETVDNISGIIGDLGESVGDLGSVLDDAQNAADDIQTDVRAFLDSETPDFANADDDGGFEAVGERVSSSIEKIDDELSSIAQRIKKLQNDASSTAKNTIKKLRNVQSKLKAVKDSFGSMKTKIRDYQGKIQAIEEKITNSIQNMFGSIADLSGEIVNNITGMGHDAFFAGFRPDLVREIQENVLYGDDCFKPEWSDLQKLEKEAMSANEKSGSRARATLDVLTKFADHLVSTNPNGALCSAIRSTNERLQDIYSSKKEGYYHFVVDSLSVYPLDKFEILPVDVDPAKFVQSPPGNSFDSAKKINYSGDDQSNVLYQKDKILAEKEKILRGSLGGSPRGIYSKMGETTSNLRAVSKSLRFWGRIFRCSFRSSKRRLGRELCRESDVVSRTIDNINLLKNKVDHIHQLRDVVLPDKNRCPVMLSIVESLPDDYPDATSLFSPKRLSYSVPDRYDFVSQHNPSFNDTKFESTALINIEKRTQWTRAVNPMINSLRPGLRNHWKERFPLSNLASYFMTWTYRYVLDESRDVRRAGSAHMYVVRPGKTKSSSPFQSSTKTNELWSNNAVEADDRFSVVVAVQMNEHQGISVFNHKSRIREGTVSFAQAVFYPRDGFYATSVLPTAQNKKIYQPQTAWDTLQWKWANPTRRNADIIAMEWESEPDDTETPGTKYEFKFYDPKHSSYTTSEPFKDVVPKLNSALYAPSWDAVLSPITPERIRSLGQISESETIQRSAKTSAKYRQLMIH